MGLVNGQVKLENKSVRLGCSGVAWLTIFMAGKRHKILSLWENHVTAVRYL